MAVSLKTLITVAPFDNETRSQLLAKLDSLNDDQKFRLSSACWTSLSQQFQARYKARVAQELLDIREGKKQFSKEEMQQIEQNLYQEFAKLLSSAETEEGIEEVRQELQKYSPQQLETKPASPPQSPPQPPVNPGQGNPKKTSDL